jgi:calcineurin-like phosphoesterase family protein
MSKLKHFIVSDWHLGEDRWDLMQRPGFKDAQDMVDKFVEYHNELVGPNDFVYVVGDAVNQKTPEFLEQVSRFNGKKILFRGNHDRVFSDEDLKPYFVNVRKETNDGMVLKVGDIKCYIQHYPTESKEEYFNLVGHIHSSWKYQINAFNVGVDCNHYRPHNIQTAVPFAFKAINQFYDDDVWVCNHKSQLKWYDERGKKGRYLDVDGFVGGEK